MAEWPSGDVPLRMHRVAIAIGVAVLALAALAAALAWREYDDARERAANDQRARAELAVSIFDTYFAGQVSTLQGIAAAPVVVNGNATGMSEYFRRVQPPQGGTFTGGLGWVDREGVSRASSNPGGASGTSVADRSFYRTVIETGQPFVSEGLTSRVSGQRVIVTAVPTRDADGAVSGVLAGALLVEPTEPGQRALDLGYAGLEILDRDGKSLLAGFSAPANAALVQRVRDAPAGVLTSTAGLSGADDRVVAFATSRLPAWTVVIDRPRSAIFGAARTTFLFELALITGVALATLGAAAFVIARARRAARRRGVRERQHGTLARNLASASAVVEVADALVAALEAAQDGTRVAVAWAAQDRLGVRIAAASDELDALAGDEATLTEALDRPYGSGLPLDLPTEARVAAELPALHAALGQARAAYAAPLTGSDGERVGAVLLVFATETALDEAARDDVAALGEQAARALERARAFEREHDVAMRLQRSLLPAQLPSIASIDLAGRYRAGTGALEIGGDWYDVVRRPDGIVHLVVGDVAGRGVNAAILMGRLSTAFRAYALDDTTAGDVLRHLLRHVGDDDMATAVCLTLDPYTGRARYASAGHPPPLLLDDDAGTTAHLDQALAPPLGFVRPEAIREEVVALPPRATLVAYTDGLVERRDAIIDDGIARLSAVVAASARSDADGVATAVLDGVLDDGAARDDVALLVVRLLGPPAVLDVEVPALPASLAPLRHRLSAWLTLRGVDDAKAADAVLAVSEACNNAVEHAYATRPGTVRVVAEHGGASLRMVVEDAGGWRETEPDPERGRGIPIMHGVMERVDIERQPAATRVTLLQRLDA